MSMLAVKAALGAAVVVLMSLISKYGHYYLVGLVPLFPMNHSQNYLFGQIFTFLEPLSTILYSSEPKKVKI